jgi:hypothetical protein
MNEWAPSEAREAPHLRHKDEVNHNVDYELHKDGERSEAREAPHLRHNK